MRRFFAVALCLLLPLAAEAKKKEKGNKGKEKETSPSAEVAVSSAQLDLAAELAFTAHQREGVRRVFVERHGRGHCPPGLAKKNNGCLPPGQAKKRYVIGRALSPSVRIDPIPDEVRVRIGDPPRGYRYGIVDGDLVKLAVGTLLVVDAIDGLVD